MYFGDIAFRVEEVVYEGRILRVLENNNPLHPPGQGDRKKVHLDTKNSTDFTPLKRGDERSEGGLSIWDILERYGQLPLPPYIEYSKEKE